MNIQRITSANLAVNTYKKSKPVQSGQGVSKSDGIVLSDAGKIFADAMQKVKSFPEVREDKVAQLANSIKNGTYKMNNEEIAKKIIQGAV